MTVRVAGGVIKTYVHSYNTKILNSYGGGRAQIDSAKGKGLSGVCVCVCVCVCA